MECANSVLPVLGVIFLAVIGVGIIGFIVRQLYDFFDLKKEWTIFKKKYELNFYHYSENMNEKLMTREHNLNLWDHIHKLEEKIERLELREPKGKNK